MIAYAIDEAINALLLVRAFILEFKIPLVIKDPREESADSNPTSALLKSK
jgi:hypothetical protein